MEELTFNNFIENYIEWKMKSSPTISTMMGYDKYNNLIEDLSMPFMEQSVIELKEFLRKSTKFGGKFNSLQDEIDYALFERDIKIQIREIEKFKSHITNPDTYSGLALHSIYLLSKRTSIPPEERIEAILTRMNKIPELIETGIQNLNNPSPYFIESALNTCNGGFVFMPHLISSLEKEFPQYSKDLNKGKEIFLKSLEKYRDFLKNDLSQKADGTYAIGRELFDELLYEGYMLDYGSEEVLNIGYEVFKKTKEELEKLAKEIDPSRTWQDIYSDLRLDHPSPHNVVETYREYMEKAKMFVIENDLVDFPPDEIIKVKPTPEFQRALMPTAAYQPPAVMDKVKEGVFLVTPVNTSLEKDKIEAHLRDHNIAEIVTTTLHEAYPGHHLQLTYATKHKSLMRRHVFTPIFAEGWALYCEQLLTKEYGYLYNPRYDIAYLRRVLWRALRVILDVSLHTKNMTVEEGISLMVKELLFSEASARGEVVRYTMTPTQPLSYLIGKLELLKIREEYKKLKGNDYSMKQFHNDLLSTGTLPVRLLRKAMQVI